MLESPVTWNDFTLYRQQDRVTRDAWTKLITVDGLWGAADLRQERQDLPGRHGTRSGDSFKGPKVITMTAEVRARNLPALRREQRNVQAAFWETGAGLIRYKLAGEAFIVAEAKINQDLDMGEEQPDARYARPFVISLIMDDPRFYEDSWNMEDITDLGFSNRHRYYGPETSGGRLVREYPVAAPGDPRARIYGLDDVSARLIVNSGSVDTHPVTVLHGPMTDPKIINRTTGDSIVFAGLTLASDETLRIDHGSEQILLNGSIESYAGLKPLQSTFWSLKRGDNQVEVAPFNFGPGSHAEIYWRNAYG